MTRSHTLVVIVALTTLAACGGGGRATLTVGPATWNDGSCDGNIMPEGQYLVKTASEINNIRAKVASTGTATVGLTIAGQGIRMIITSPPAGTIILNNETLLSLDAALAITRDKAIHAKNIRTRVELVLTKYAAVPGAVSAFITKQECDDNFANVEFHDSGVVLGEFSPDTFWGLAGGHRVDFTWMGE